MTSPNLADINATIRHWQNIGVDYSEAWFALGRRDVCWREWDQVRAYMIQLSMQRAQLRRAA